MCLLPYYCDSASVYTYLKSCIYCQTTVLQPAYTHTPKHNLKPCTTYHTPAHQPDTDTKSMASSLASTAIHRHLKHGIKPLFYCHYPVHQPAYTQTPNAWPSHAYTAILLRISQTHIPAQTPNAWPKVMHLLPNFCASASVCTDTKCKACIYCHTTVHQPV